MKDLEACVRFVLEACVAARLPRDEVAALRLLVLSDMAFEACWSAGGGGGGMWTTQLEALQRAFAAAGYAGAVPEVTFWNLSSKALVAGEMHCLPGVGKGKGAALQLELASDSSAILCGACLAFDKDGGSLGNCCYTRRSALGGCLRHSGDTVVDSKSKHRIEVCLGSLPPTVHALCLTLCACGATDLSGFERPYIALGTAGTAGSLCRYDLRDAKKAPSALMAAIVRVDGGGGGGGGWAITALGDTTPTRCCGNYSEITGLCRAQLKGLRETAAAAAAAGPLGGRLALPASGDAPGVRLLSGFSADMLRSLVKTPEDAAAEAKASAAAVAAAEAAADAAAAEEEARKAVAAAAAAAAAAGGAATEEATAGSRGSVAAADEAVAAAAARAVSARAAADAAGAEASAAAAEACSGPGAALRRVLRGKRYWAVREAVAASGEVATGKEKEECGGGIGGRGSGGRASPASRPSPTRAPSLPAASRPTSSPAS